MNRRRLYRSRYDQRIAGVAGGVADYFDLDPSLVRIVWAVSVFAGGLTLLLYIVMAVLVPLEPANAPAPGPWQPGSNAWGTPGPAGQGGPGGASADAGVDDAGAAAAGTAAAGSAAAGAGPDASGAAAGYSGGGAYGQGWGYDRGNRRVRRSGSVAPFVGIVLIIFGALALADQAVPTWNVNEHFWPAAVLALGVFLVIRAFRPHADEL